MIHSIEKEGKTREEARRAALEALGITEDDDFHETLLVSPKSGFLGIGARLAKVQVTFDDGKPEPKPEPKSAPKAKTGPRPETKGAPRRADAAKETAKSAAPAPKAEEPKTAAPAEAAQAITEFAPGSQAERTYQFLTGLLRHMDVEATVAIFPRETGGLDVKLDGPNMGAVIGRRGETLDAIQHLVNYSVNRGSDKHAHISVDAEGYRSKREESLAHLAQKMAAKAIKYKRSMALEPMNSYERHVIHASLQDYEGVTTSSTGTEPNRRVVVNYVRPEGESPAEPRRHSRPDRRDRGERRDRPQRAPKAETPAEPKTETKAPEAKAETLPPDFPEDYTPPVKNKPQSREWC